MGTRIGTAQGPENGLRYDVSHVCGPVCSGALSLSHEARQHEVREGADARLPGEAAAIRPEAGTPVAGEIFFTGKPRNVVSVHVAGSVSEPGVLACTASIR